MAITYTAISSQTISGSSTTAVTFSSIPQTYTDLIIVWNGGASANGQIYLTFNGDTASNYSDTNMYGTGSAAGSNRRSNNTRIQDLTIFTGENIGTIQVFNYTNTTTFKTVLGRGGTTTSGGDTYANVGLWRKTPEAITSITLTHGGGNNYTSGTTFSLYGIKAT